MKTKTIRKIVKIDEEKCNGCGLCLPNCVEGALRIVDGKARLVSETYCDGMGACLGECPQGAITIEEREAADFNEEAVKHFHEEEEHGELPCGCPSSAVQQFEPRATLAGVAETTSPSLSMLTHWPIQLALVPPGARFLKNADVMLVADCVPFAYPDFHRRFLKDHAVLVACPKLDDFQSHFTRLAGILERSDVKSLTVVHMEVPCCSGLVYMLKNALAASGKNLTVSEVTIGIDGSIKTESSEG